MLGCSRIINLLFTITLVVLLGVVTWAEIYTRSTVSLISDREVVKGWMRDEKGQEAFLGFIIENTYAEDSKGIVENVITKDEYRSLVDEQISKEELAKLSDNTIDQLYDWLEGKEDIPSIDLLDSESGIDLSFIDNILEDKLGELSKVVDSRDIIFLTSKLNIIDTEQVDLAKMPELYSALLALPDKLLIAGLIISVIIILSLRSLRAGLLLVGVAIGFSGSIFLFEQSNTLVHEVLGSKYFPLDLPSAEQIPGFLRTLWDIASEDILQIARKYAIFAMAGGVGIAVGSQLAISERVVDDEDDEDEDDDDDEEN
ncbi:hypothetical protein H6762_02310 [Candidatus Nomurabacteria bacterium]|nr:hypothetical protein [Candidatus Nomurabacteria bacterium]